MYLVLVIFCTFATESDYPKRKTFCINENEKLSKMENITARESIIKTKILERYT